MKKKLKKGLLLFGAAFTLLFIIRLIYGYMEYPTNYVVQNEPSPSNFEFSRKNYASAKMKLARIGGEKQQIVNIDQKYEKIASISSCSTHFEKDEDKLRSSIKQFSALIQYEQASGLPGNRLLQMAIGVQPEKFDRFIKKIKGIAKNQSIQIDKFDKTNEYKDLMAKMASLKATRDSLITLKGKGGKIEEFITLENRILEIEGELQELGVRLGDFDMENEFCTVKFTLAETSIGQSISFLHRLVVAFEWTVKYYLLMVAILFFACLSLLILFALIEKLKVFGNTVFKSDDHRNKGIQG